MYLTAALITSLAGVGARGAGYGPGGGGRELLASSITSPSTPTLIESAARDLWRARAAKVMHMCDAKCDRVSILVSLNVSLLLWHDHNGECTHTLNTTRAAVSWLLTVIGSLIYKSLALFLSSLYISSILYVYAKRRERKRYGENVFSRVNTKNGFEVELRNPLLFVGIRERAHARRAVLHIYVYTYVRHCT